MHTKKLAENLFQVDLQTGGLQNLISSYVLKGEKAIIVDCGPTSSIPNLMAGLKELTVKPQDVAYVAVTHVHADHSGGAGTLIKKLPNAKIVAHVRGVPHLKTLPSCGQQPKKRWITRRRFLVNRNPFQKTG